MLLSSSLFLSQLVPPLPGPVLQSTASQPPPPQESQARAQLWREALRPRGAAASTRLT